MTTTTAFQPHAISTGREASGEATLVVNHDGMVDSVSPAAGRLLGVARQDLEGHAILSLIHRQDVLNAVVNLESIRREDTRTVTWVSRMRTRNRWEWFKVSATGLRYDRGHQTGAVLLMQPLNDL